jgi:hypothetical protein
MEQDTNLLRSDTVYDTGLIISLQPSLNGRERTRHNPKVLIQRCSCTTISGNSRYIGSIEAPMLSEYLPPPFQRRTKWMNVTGLETRTKVGECFNLRLLFLSLSIMHLVLESLTVMYVPPRRNTPLHAREAAGKCLLRVSSIIPRFMLKSVDTVGCIPPIVVSATLACRKYPHASEILINSRA